MLPDLPLYPLRAVVAAVVVPAVPLGALGPPSILEVAGTAVAGGRHLRWSARGAREVLLINSIAAPKETRATFSPVTGQRKL